MLGHWSPKKSTWMQLQEMPKFQHETAWALVKSRQTKRRKTQLWLQSTLFFLPISFLLPFSPAQWAVGITSVLNRKNGFAHRAKLAQKLRWRKATKSNFCDKVFIGFENHVIRYFYRFDEPIFSYLIHFKYFFYTEKKYFPKRRNAAYNRYLASP